MLPVCELSHKKQGLARVWASMGTNHARVSLVRTCISHNLVLRWRSDRDDCPPYLIRCHAWDWASPPFIMRDCRHHFVALLMDYVVQDTPCNAREMMMYIRATLKVRGSCQLLHCATVRQKTEVLA